ncbi:hypothetical protein [Pseudomonas syringae]|uniref:hypothetical protein n=1 Tax=Pseudomonas syringae TaxID=317 RepID=UPI0001CC319A|nr:hypothetical protein [Pseudomonas syringae]KEZ64329.1 hypothetical protein C5I_0137725 [Pseudomonas syringae pv. syringae FF5]KTB94497.1 hypothetical protein AO073_17825 [Pseudomonas syringae ICMP 11293]MCF8986334.1 hypothetical protein [Pseudomonas syringae]MCF9002115.1 hypothetical protein [Pseudomonas syringae]QVI77061.1 hypothetical protein KHW13_08335 [Pseudomonas syringae]
MPDYDEVKWGAMDVNYLVVETDGYIVFVDSSNTLDWKTSDEYDRANSHSQAGRQKTLSQIGILECKPNSHLPDKFSLDFKRLLGEALACALEGEFDTASGILSNAEIYLKNRSEEISREWYLTEAGKTVAAILVMGVAIWLFRDVVKSMVGTLAFQLVLTAVAGAMGALLSIIMRMGGEKLDCHVGKNIHELESRYRIIAGMLSAIFVYLAVNSGLAFSFADKGGTGFLFVGFLSGLTERLAPSISAKATDAEKA